MAKKTSSKKEFSIDKMSDFIDDIGKEAHLMIENDKETTFIGTGVYALNGLISASILNGGVPDDRFTIFAGPPATGKSYIMYNIARNAQKQGKYILFIDTEHSVNKVVLQNFGIDPDPKKLKLISSNSVESLKTFLTKFFDRLKTAKEEGEVIPEVAIFLDSIGQLASEKEKDDALEGKNKVDMTRAKSIKQLFRIINADMGYLGIPMVASNHTYEDISAFFPQAIMAGGKGAEYTASTIIFLSTAKLKTGREDDLDLNATGVIVTAKAKKNRFAKLKKIKFEIDSDFGTNPFKGLEYWCTPENFATVGIAKGKKVENEDGTIGIEGGGTKWYIRHLDKSVFEKQLFTKAVFTDEVLQSLEPIIEKYFKYSTFEENETEQDIFEDDETENKTDIQNLLGDDFDNVDDNDLFA